MFLFTKVVWRWLRHTPSRLCYYVRQGFCRWWWTQQHKMVIQCAATMWWWCTVKVAIADSTRGNGAIFPEWAEASHQVIQQFRVAWRPSVLSHLATVQYNSRGNPWRNGDCWCWDYLDSYQSSGYIDFNNYFHLVVIGWW